MKENKIIEPLQEDKVNMSTGASSAGSVKFNVPDSKPPPQQQPDRYIPARTEI